MEQPAEMHVAGPTCDPAPMIACGPMDAEGSTTASSANTAVGCAPGTIAGAGQSDATARAKAARGFADRISVRPAGNSLGTMRQPAFDASAAAIALRFAANES